MVDKQDQPVVQEGNLLAAVPAASASEDSNCAACTLRCTRKYDGLSFDAVIATDKEVQQ
jgi:hypothetical protein